MNLSCYSEDAKGLLAVISSQRIGFSSVYGGVENRIAIANIHCAAVFDFPDRCLIYRHLKGVTRRGRQQYTLPRQKRDFYLLLNSKRVSHGRQT